MPCLEHSSLKFCWAMCTATPWMPKSLAISSNLTGYRFEIATIRSIVISVAISTPSLYRESEAIRLRFHLRSLRFEIARFYCDFKSLRLQLRWCDLGNVHGNAGFMGGDCQIFFGVRCPCQSWKSQSVFQPAL